MRFDDTFISSKNLLTCCVYTLLDIGDSNPEWDVGDGQEIMCAKSGNNRSHKMFLWNGIWRWINPMIVEAEESERLRIQKKKGGFLGPLNRR